MEMTDPGLLRSLAGLRDLYPELPLTLEIHEGVVTTGRAMKDFRTALRALAIDLAYDDFGAGQARLVELAEVPPDYLKFDMSLVRDIHRAGAGKQRLVASLVRMVCDLGIACVAEGVETAGELLACRQMGFQFAQGYHIGRPGPPEDWVVTR
jgi:EAL domain-containing protein (putative c-di-GMP-specific phosphodiesterase class I)